MTGRALTRIATIVDGVESRPGKCPACGGPSRECRFAPRSLLTPQTKALLEEERPFMAQACTKCIAKREAQEVERQREQRRQLALTALEVPALYANVSIETFDTHAPDPADRTRLEHAKALAREYIEAWPGVPAITVLLGGCGTGKGHWTWSVAKALANIHGTSCRVAVLSDVIRDLREAWNSDGGDSEAKRLARYRGVDLLVIDEVSRHAFFGQPQQHLYDLCAWREVRLKPTIITSNEIGTDLESVLGPALSSRAAGAGAIVDFGTYDWRLVSATRLRATLSRIA